MGWASSLGLESPSEFQLEWVCWLELLSVLA